MITDSLIGRVKIHESLRLKPYRCTAGKLTIGYGRNLDDVGLSNEEAEYLLLHDLENAEREASKLDCYKKLSQNRRDILIEMVFNLGYPRLCGFKKMIQALDRGDYNGAANEMLDSKWARDVGERARTLAYFMRIG